MSIERATKGKVSGIVPPIGTPLTSDERVDEKGLRKLVNHLLDNGVHGLAVNTTMGGFALMRDDEQIRAVEIVVDEVRGRVPILAGASDTGTRRVIEKAKTLAALKPTFLIILPPYYFLLNVESARRFYREIADAITHPLFIYDNPYLTKYRMPLDLMFELCEIPHYVGIKETDQDVDRWQSLVHHFKGDPNFTILIGTEFLVRVALTMGVDSVMGGLHNITPRLAVDLYNAVKTGDLEKAQQLQMRLIDIFQILKQEDVWGGFEAGLRSLGICEKVTASPYSSLSTAGQAKVEEILKRYLQ